MIVGQAGPGDRVQRGWEARLTESVGAAGPVYTSRASRDRGTCAGRLGSTLAKGRDTEAGNEVPGLPVLRGIVRDQARV